MMKNHAWKGYAGWILLTFAVGILSGWLTRDDMRFFNAAVRQPPLSPPQIVFPVVWTVLYLLMAIGAARVYLSPASEARSRGLSLYLAQLAFNFFWSILFFHFRLYGIAFIWLAILWILILFMTFSFRETDPLAAKLQIPYMIWVLFAGYLTLGVWFLNR